MTKNADEPAFPTQGNSAPGELVGGLTKREKFAETAMLGLLSNPNSDYPEIEELAEQAVMQADALLAALEKQPSNTPQQ